jgi:5,10-methylenetetrahydrofolate reductase
MFIDVAIPGDRNVITKEAEKILKYNDLILKEIPVILGITGIISKSLRQYLSNIPGKHDIKELQKTAILGTTHILRKVLM